MGREPGGGVDEHQPPAQRVAAELAQTGQIEGAAVGMGVQERFDVADIDGGPVGLVPVGGQELGEVAQGGQACLECGVPARVGAGAPGAVAPGD